MAETNYADYRQNIKSGDLIAWSSGGSGLASFFDNIIRIFTESEYTHVAIAWWQGDRLFVIEAIPPKVRVYPLSGRLPFYHIPMNIDWNENMVKYLLEKVGQPYSYFEAIKAYFTKPDNNNTWECAELCTDFYANIGINFGDAFTPAKLVQDALASRNTDLKYIGS